MLWFIGITASVVLLLHLKDINEARHRESESKRFPHWMEQPGWGPAEQKRWEGRWMRRFFIFLAICVLLFVVSGGGLRPPASRYM
jgi:hypothetical protein